MARFRILVGGGARFRILGERGQVGGGGKRSACCKLIGDPAPISAK